MEIIRWTRYAPFSAGRICYSMKRKASAANRDRSALVWGLRKTLLIFVMFFRLEFSAHALELDAFACEVFLRLA